MTLHVLKNGYLAFSAGGSGLDRKQYVHHIVAGLAHGPRPTGLHVLHRDDDKLNNDPGNLYYGTQKQNMDDCERNGHRRKGEACVGTKLTEEGAREIYRLAHAGHNQRRLGRQFGVTQSTVDRIKRKLNWKHIHEQ